MTADDLSAPLGQQPAKRRWRLPVSVPQVIAGALALFFAAFVVWAIVGENPLGGEPVVAVPIDLHPVVAAKKSETPSMPEAAPGAQPPGSGPATVPAPPAQNNAAAGSKTVTIIDGKTGARQEVVIPDGGDGASPPKSPALDQALVEMTPRGPIPKVAADGRRPAEAFARPVTPLPGRPDAPPRCAHHRRSRCQREWHGGGNRQDAGCGDTRLYALWLPTSRARSRAHGGPGTRILLEVPLEPFSYPDNDSGPQTLLTSLTPEQNLERLHWLMSRFQGYVGIIGAMGARFTASEQSFAPVLRETAKRGLIFVDDGANARSVAGRIAGANSLPFAKVDVIIDAVPTPEEIDHALGRLEMAARERTFAVGMSSALPVSIEHISKWAKAAESRGLLLVPITAVAVKAKQS